MYLHNIVNVEISGREDILNFQIVSNVPLPWEINLFADTVYPFYLCQESSRRCPPISNSLNYSILYENVSDINGSIRVLLFMDLHV